MPLLFCNLFHIFGGFFGLCFFFFPFHCQKITVFPSNRLCSGFSVRNSFIILKTYWVLVLLLLLRNLIVTASYVLEDICLPHTHTQTILIVLMILQDARALIQYSYFFNILGGLGRLDFPLALPLSLSRCLPLLYGPMWLCLIQYEYVLFLLMTMYF